MSEKAVLYKKYFSNKGFLSSFFSAVLLLLASFWLNYYAGLFATRSASNSVSDIVLDNIRTYDVDGVFVYGAIAFYMFLLVHCLLDPKRLPFTFKSLALFVVVRAVFISLTHIGPSPDQLIINSQLMNKFAFGGDLFFSGHTGAPFLMALVYWKSVRLRVFFAVSSVIFGVVVLLAHIHYSIDVLSAFFITYAIYHIAEVMFKNDRELFYRGL